MNIRKNNVGAYCIRPNAPTIQVDVFRAYAIRPYNHVVMTILITTVINSSLFIINYTFSPKSNRSGCLPLNGLK